MRVELIFTLTLQAMLAFALGYTLYKAVLMHKYRSNAAQLAKLEHGLEWLAVIALVAPFLGLAGTVWSIMQALSLLGSGGMDVARIAKPVGEALMTTLWGILAAIPATAGQYLLKVGIGRRIDELDTNFSLQTGCER